MCTEIPILYTFASPVKSKQYVIIWVSLSNKHQSKNKRQTYSMEN